jgi:hypothetical protein
MTDCNHEWKDVYYGTICAKCGEFYPDGCAPWEWTEEDERRAAKEEYYHNHGTCEVCGGEWGDGWSTCTCDLWELGWRDFVHVSKSYVGYGSFMTRQGKIQFWLQVPRVWLRAIVIAVKDARRDKLAYSYPIFYYALTTAWDHYR